MFKLMLRLHKISVNLFAHTLSKNESNQQIDKGFSQNKEMTINLLQQHSMSLLQWKLCRILPANVKYRLVESVWCCGMVSLSHWDSKAFEGEILQSVITFVLSLVTQLKTGVCLRTGGHHEEALCEDILLTNHKRPYLLCLIYSFIKQYALGCTC